MKRLGLMPVTSMFLTIGLIAVVGVTFLYHSQAAAVYYVSPSGNDTNPGTQSQPWRTLTRALPALSAGDTLYLRGGTYDGFSLTNTQRGTSSLPIRMTSYPGEIATIQGLVRFHSIDYWRIDSLNFTWRAGDPYNQHMVRITNGVGWIFEKNNVYGAQSYANLHVTSWGTDSEPRNAVVRYNKIHDVPYVSATNVNRQHNMYVGGPRYGSLLIERNLLWNVPNGDNVKIGGGESSSDTYNVTVRYNTMYNASSNMTLMGGTFNHKVHNNIMYKSGPRYTITLWEVRNSGSSVYNNFYGSTPGLMQEQGNIAAGTAASLNGGGNILGDPGFINAAAGDFRTSNTAAASYGYYAGSTSTSDTTPPTTSMTSPASGSSVSVGGTITLSANASDNVGVAKVGFYNGTTLLYSDTTSPYSYDWSTAGQTAGAKSLTARAYDAAGNSTTSAAVSLSLTSTTSLPDVVVTSLTAAPAAPKEGERVVFTAVVKNQGTAPTPPGITVGVGFFRGTVLLNWTTRGPLAAGETTTMTATHDPSGAAINYWTAIAGTHTITAHIDDINRFVESNEMNNKVTLNLSVGATVISGDINQDNRVNAIDLSILLTRDGQNYPAADFNKDGVVGAADMAILLSKWTW